MLLTLYTFHFVTNYIAQKRPMIHIEQERYITFIGNWSEDDMKSNMS